MGIGSSIFLIAIGAIVRYAVTDTIDEVNLATVGLILMIAGAVGLVVSLFGPPPSRVAVTRHTLSQLTADTSVRRIASNTVGASAARIGSVKLGRVRPTRIRPAQVAQRARRSAEQSLA